MQFIPKTEEELELGSLLPEGIYQYIVTSSSDKPNKNGDLYTAITLDVYDSHGGKHIIFTNLAFIKLLKHFCDVNDMQKEYQSGNIPPESFMRKCKGLVHIGIEAAKVNPNGGMYKAKNVVLDYIIDEHAETRSRPEALIDSMADIKSLESDEIPF